MAKTAQTVTIRAGQSLSDAANLVTGAVAMLYAPPDWSPANVSFQVSADGNSFSDLFDTDGVEIVKAIRVGSAVVVDQSLTQAVNYLKIRSGPRNNPVAQEADRVITLMVV
jgi:hypothetical protein